MQAIANSICKRPSYFLLLGTKDYRQLMLISPRKCFDAQMNLKVSIHNYLINTVDPSYYDLNKLEKIAALKLDPKSLHRIQHETLSEKYQQQIESKDSLRQYLQNIGRIQLLDAAQEIEFARQVAELEKIEYLREELQKQLKRNPLNEELANSAGLPLLVMLHHLTHGRCAKNKLIEANLRLVVSIAKKYTNRGVDILDLIQEGNLGLIRSVEKFDVTKGNKFSTYATWWIWQSIKRAISNQDRIIRLPIHLQEEIQRIKKTTRQLSLEIGGIPKQKEIAACLDMTVENLQSIVKSALPIISLDTPISAEKDTTLADLIEFDGDTPEAQLLKTILGEELESLLAILQPRDRQILQMRYGLDDGREKSLSEIGQHFNLTRERIRQIINKTLNKLRSGQPHRTAKRQFIHQTVTPTFIKETLICSKASTNKPNKEERNLNYTSGDESNHSITHMREINLSATIETMEYNLENLLQQLAFLQQNFFQLSERLTKAATELQDPGIPLTGELILELEECQRNFLELRDKVLALVASSKVSPIPNRNKIVSRRDLQYLLQNVAEIEEKNSEGEKVRSCALRVLQRILSIVHRVESDFLPLQECQVKAREYQVILESAGCEHPDIQSLADGNHPLSKLLTLISDWEDLEDERLADLQDAVIESFGRTLAIAAVRGKLTFKEEVVQDLALLSSTQADERISRVEPHPSNQVLVSQPAERLIAIQTTPKGETVTPPSLKLETDQDAIVKEQTEEEKKLQYQLTPENTESISVDIKEEDPIAVRNQIWQLLRENQLCLAHHLARCIEALYPNLQPLLPSGMIRAVILGRHVRYDAGLGEIANVLRRDFTNLSNNYFVNGDSECNQAVSLLLATAALRPALLAPNTQAPAILISLRLGEGLNQLYKYCQTIAKYGDQGIALDTTAIKTVRSQTVWEADVTSLRQQVEGWWTQAPRLNMIYGPARAVWNEWIKPNKLIYALLLPIIQNDLSKLDVAKTYVKRLSTEAQINEEVKRTQRELGLINGSSYTITGIALNQIRQHVREGVDFAHQWISLQEYRMSKDNNYTHSQARQLQQDLANLHAYVLQELDVFNLRNSSVLLKAGIYCCKIAVEDIRNLFEPNATLPTVEPDLKYLLNAELLLIPSLPMDSDWLPEVKSPEFFVKEILNLIEQNHLNWVQAFQARSNGKDHEATGRIIEYLRVYPDTSIDTDQLEQQRNIGIKSCREELEKAVKDTRKLLEENVALGLLRETERLDYAARIEKIENSLKTILRFSEKISHLLAISQAINTKRQETIDDTRNKLIEEIGQENPVFDRISSVLDKGDFLTANEYIDMVQQGRQIPEPENRRDAFKDFFKDNYTSIEDVLEPIDHDRNSIKRRELINNISQRNSIKPLQMRQVPGAQAKQASQMLDTWFAVKGRKQGITDKDVSQILSNLGFNTANLGIKKVGNNIWIDVTTEPIQDKKRCPVPAFGSQAQGRYRILCIWDRPPEEDILNAIGDTSHGSQVLVFHFGRMTEKRRRDLARLCRERRRTFIVIDDTLIFYLCGERGARLPILFECSLPFTFLEPYTTTSGFVPLEMFYGRERERDSIICSYGFLFYLRGTTVR